MKNNLLKYALTFLSTAMFCSTSHADHHKKPVDLAGAWKTTATSDSGEREITWTFKKEDGKLTGTSLSQESGRERKIDRIKIDEKTVTLEIDIEREGNTGVIKIVAEEKEAGKLTGNWSINGSDGTEYMSGTLTSVKQVEVDYAGDWNVTAVIPDGGEYSGTLTLKKDGDNYSGSSASANGGEKNLESVKIDGKHVTYTVDFERDGETGIITVTANRKEDGSLAGRWSLAGSDGAEIAGDSWKAVRKK